MIALAAMQGLGKPGSNIYSTTGGAPADRSFWFPGYAEGGISGDTANTASGYSPASAHVAQRRHHLQSRSTAPKGRWATGCSSRR